MRHLIFALSAVALAHPAASQCGSCGPPIVYTVTNAAPFGLGSLHNALLLAAGDGVPSDIQFNAAHVINQTIPLPLITDNCTRILGESFPGVRILSAGPTVCLTLDAVRDCVVRGLQIENFGQIGINVINGANHNCIGGDFAAGRNLLIGNFFGIRLHGVGTDANVLFNNHVFNSTHNGIELLDGASGNVVGGLAPSQRNYSFWNGTAGVGSGIFLGGMLQPVLNNIVEGNFVGTDTSGFAPAGNASAGVELVGNLVGMNQIRFNVIGANGMDGVIIAAAAHDNLVADNFIGVDHVGLGPLGNTRHGVFVEASPNNFIGPGNTIGHNGMAGVEVAGFASVNCRIDANRVGVNAPANAVAPNGSSGVVLRDGVAGCQVTGNVLSGNALDGVEVHGNGPNLNRIALNTIGLDATGTAALPNLRHGVHLRNFSQQTTVEDNTICANFQFGIALTTDVMPGNLVRANRIGEDAAAAPQPNALGGIFLASRDNLIGGPAPPDANIIRFNGGWGIRGDGAAATVSLVANRIFGNSIDNNTRGGVYLGPRLMQTKVGDYVGGAPGNHIHANGGPGVEIDWSTPFRGNENEILSNSITGNTAGVVLTGTGNDNIPPPVVLLATTAGVWGQSTVTGATVQVFMDAGAEGEFLLGELLAGTVGSTWFLAATPALGFNVTATNTDPWGTALLPETSGFSPGVIVQPKIGANYCGPAQPNSSGAPAALCVTGSNVPSDNDVTLNSLQMPLGKFGYFLTSQNQNYVMPPGSQGFLCLGGDIGRYNTAVMHSGATGSFSHTIDTTNMPVNPHVPILSGQSWNFQCWFRDNNPGVTSNFTDAVQVLFP
ncbi:MAG: hypothetical protein GY711_04195 [bacterium]|nr:hypothetical protein [bacterium]